MVSVDPGLKENAGRGGGILFPRSGAEDGWIFGSSGLRAGKTNGGVGSGAAMLKFRRLCRLGD